ncbi:asparagine synthase-related protein [Streptomyces niveus]|uniref:asparagine synthase-related protein n=1 Tax=Streptomyces niveus TaxID=193462 RepID=UPI00386D196D|nr:asparagine synthase-related protein [Streptomyces niveus]
MRNGLLGVFPPASSGEVVRVQGPWREGELRRVDGPEGTVVMLGQCLSDDDRLRRTALRALASGGPDELTRLPGSYLCLVIRHDELTAYVDAAGQHPLFFRDTGTRLVFGTRPVSVADAADARRRPDTAVLAAGIFCPGAPSLTGERSVVTGVSKVGGGQALRRTARGKVERWVHEPLETDPGASLARGAEALRDALETAVRLRVAGTERVSADFSGGLDSTSLAFLTLRHRPGPLPVTTYRGSASACDDLVHAERFARLDPRLRMEVVTGTRETLTYQGLCDRSGGAGHDSDEPDSAVAALARSRLRLGHVARLGAGVHLGGEGGDALLVAPPCYLAALARPERLRQLARESRVLARARQEAPSAVAARAVGLARTPLATALRRLADGFERHATGGTGRADAHDVGWLDAIAWWPGPGSEAGWLTRAASTELAGLAREAAGSAGRTAGSRAGDLTALDNVRTSGAVQRQLSEMARPFGVWPQAPFLDSDVIRACAALPAHLRAAPPAFKPLLGAALADLVPAPVLARRTKGDYGDEDYQGARACAPELRGLLVDSRLAELGVVEPSAVVAALDRAVMGLRVPFPALNRLLAAEIWLRNTTWH